MFTLRETWIVVLLGTLQLSSSFGRDNKTMRCFYAGYGSLTVFCEYVTTPRFFKSAEYIFNSYDVQCLNCNLKSIVTNSFNIPRNFIERLVLKESGITELQHGAFNGLRCLEDLDLSNNDIRTVHRGNFEGTTRINVLNLRNNSLVFISNEAFVELSNLTTLILSESRLPLVIQTKAFIGLRNLKILNVSKSQITNVTSIFNSLTSLQYLDLSGNSISTIEGKEFENLTSLLELNLDKNKIKFLPPLWFFCMHNLKSLRLSNNLIERIENRAFHGLTMLEFLDLGNNKIIVIPEKPFPNSHGLVSINLTRNRIDTFKINRYSGLPKLEILNLSHNVIKKIDLTLNFPLYDLQSLDLSNNNLTDLNYIDLIHKIPKISHLNLQYNYWRCDLEEEMNEVFSSDNSQFFLFNNKQESVKCNENYVRENEEVARYSLVNETTKNLYIHIIIIILIVAIVALSYRQYRFSQELHVTRLEMRRQTTGKKLSGTNVEENVYDILSCGRSNYTRCS